MQKSEVIEYFGGVVKTATALKIKHPAVSRWHEIIPEKQAMKIEKISGGELKYDPNLYTA